MHDRFGRVEPGGGVGQSWTVGDRRKINTLASRQYGAFNSRQARQAGFDKSAVRRRLDSGEWIRLDHSVYCVASAAPRWERDLAAAVLSRRQAVVTGDSAACLHGLRGFIPGRPVVLVPMGSNARSEIADIVQTKRYELVARVRVAGFEATSPVETILVLARKLSAARLEAVFDDALLSRKLTLGDFEPALAREGASRAKGLSLVRRLVADRHPLAPSQEPSYLEAMLEMVLNRGKLPPWTREHQFRARGTSARVDVFIPTWSLVIEADGRNWHSRRSDFEKDRRRDNTLATKGIQVLRFTFEMLESDPDGCLDTILSTGALRANARWFG
jgi:very-short-patch-repair endonuclease